MKRGRERDFKKYDERKILTCELRFLKIKKATQIEKSINFTRIKYLSDSN